MDTHLFHRDGPEFPVLDLVARCSFKSASSISFDLGAYVEDPPGTQPFFICHGWVDVHHPCEEEEKAQRRLTSP